MLGDYMKEENYKIIDEDRVEKVSKNIFCRSFSGVSRDFRGLDDFCE